MTDSNAPLVSVFTLAYNHKGFISKAIESILMQKTNFKIESVIGEDCSTDGTREIVMNYAEKHPDTIRVITSETNVGMRKNAIRTRLACKGKYIAFCEGDDYWIDPLKLQKQVDFLEANPDFSLCFHDAIVLWDDKSHPPKLFCAKDQKEVTTTEDVIKGWYIPTASMLMKRDYVIDQPDWFENVYNGDWALQMILSTLGKIKYIDDAMAVYRKNQGALSGGIGKNVEFVHGKKIELLGYFNDYTKGKYAQQIEERISEIRKETSNYQKRQKNKFLYWISNPKKTVANQIAKLGKQQ